MEKGGDATDGADVNGGERERWDRVHHSHGENSTMTDGRKDGLTEGSRERVTQCTPAVAIPFVASAAADRRLAFCS